MSKFRKDGGKELPPISTASLPDIVFMLLFFFMVSTTMREVTLLVDIKLPEATELSKLEKKSLVSYIYVGEPKKEFRKVFGVAPRIQLNDQWANVGDIQDYITNNAGCYLIVYRAVRLRVVKSVCHSISLSNKF